MRRISIVSILSAASIVGGCAHPTTNVDMEVFEAWFLSTKLERPDPPPSRFLNWDDAKNQGIPREKMVSIYYWDGKPCEKPSSHPIADVAKFIDENVDRRGDVWVVVQPWDLTSEKLEGYHRLLDVCSSSRANGVIIAEMLFRNGDPKRFRPPSRAPRGPSLSELIRKTEEDRRTKEAQPGATDNPDDAQRLREDH